MRLTAEEARVLGSLLEKQLATPQQYPLTLTALLAACNQTTNRDPVVTYDETTVTAAIDNLKQLRLVRSVLPSHGRSAVRYRQVVDETLALDSKQRALLGVLLLRGPQTVGELRTRTDRMVEFGGLDEIGHELEFLSTREEPLAEDIGRRPGQKEERWATPLMAAGPQPAQHEGIDAQPTRGADAEPDHRLGDGPPTPSSEIDELRADVAALRLAVGDLQEELRALRASLGG